jgi:hypothetical protein
MDWGWGRHKKQSIEFKIHVKVLTCNKIGKVKTVLKAFAFMNCRCIQTDFSKNLSY